MAASLTIPSLAEAVKIGKPDSLFIDSIKKLSKVDFLLPSQVFTPPNSIMSLVCSDNALFH